jgi:hypothetical protein
MSVTSVDLVSPVGDLTPSLFGESADALTTRLNGYLTEATTVASGISDSGQRDRAILHYAYYLAYKAIHVRLAGIASSATLQDLGSRTYSSAQIAAFAKLRDDNYVDFTELLPTASPATLGARPSSTTIAEFGW